MQLTEHKSFLHNFIYIISIYPHDLQKNAGVVILGKQASDFPNLLSEMPKHCCQVEIFYLSFLVFIKIVTNIWSCLLRSPKKSFIRAFFRT